MKRLIALALSVIFLVAGCQTGPNPETVDGQPWVPTPTANCSKYEPQPLMAIRGAHGITPTHSVRVDVFRCVGDTWVEVGNLAHIRITATSDAIAQGVVKAGANSPWPYENLAARTPFEFP